LIQNKPDKVVEMVEQVVRRAPQNAHHSLKDVALALGLSARSLQRLLMKQGTSFSQVLERSRRQRAIQLLVKEDLNISEIARMLGYSDPSDFGRAVRKWTGQSPKQWRESLLGEHRRGIAHRMS
jgi:AraC-like DNA-binding protein